MTKFALDEPSNEPSNIFELSIEQRDSALKQSLQDAASSNPGALLHYLGEATLFHRRLKQQIKEISEASPRALRTEYLEIAQLAISIDDSRIAQRLVPSEEEKQRLNGLPEYRHARIARDKQPYDNSAQKLFLSQQIGNLARLWADDAISEPVRPELYIVPDL